VQQDATIQDRQIYNIVIYEYQRFSWIVIILICYLYNSIEVNINKQKTMGDTRANIPERYTFTS
jgi:hypothetical protein